MSQKSGRARMWCLEKEQRRHAIMSAESKTMRLGGARLDYTTVIQDGLHMRVKRLIGSLGPGMGLFCLKKSPKQNIRLWWSLKDLKWVLVCRIWAPLVTGYAASELKRTLMLVPCSPFCFVLEFGSLSEIIVQIRAFFSVFGEAPLGPWDRSPNRPLVKS